MCLAHFVLCFWFVFLRLLCPVLPVSMDCPFWLHLRYSLAFIYLQFTWCIKMTVAQIYVLYSIHLLTVIRVISSLCSPRYQLLTCYDPNIQSISALYPTWIDNLFSEAVSEQQIGVTLLQMIYIFSWLTTSIEKLPILCWQETANCPYVPVSLETAIYPSYITVRSECKDIIHGEGF